MQNKYKKPIKSDTNKKYCFNRHLHTKWKKFKCNNAIEIYSEIYAFNNMSVGIFWGFGLAGTFGWLQLEFLILKLVFNNKHN